MKIKRIFFITYLIVLVSVPIIFLILPADFFDEGESVCFSILFFEQQCYGCGMTRGLLHLLHFNFSTAYEFNKLSLIVFPLLVFIWFGELRRTYRKLNPKS